MKNCLGFEGLLKDALPLWELLNDRISLDLHFLLIARLVSFRSICPQGRRHGAIVVREKRVLSMGYNGPPMGMTHCTICTLIESRGSKDWRTCPAVHSEVNALLTAARFGISVMGASLYVTKEPCDKCEASMINAGIKDIVYYKEEGDLDYGRKKLSG